MYTCIYIYDKILRGLILNLVDSSLLKCHCQLQAVGLSLCEHGIDQCRWCVKRRCTCWSAVSGVVPDDDPSNSVLVGMCNFSGMEAMADSALPFVRSWWNAGWTAVACGSSFVRWHKQSYCLRLHVFKVSAAIHVQSDCLTLRYLFDVSFSFVNHSVPLLLHRRLLSLLALRCCAPLEAWNMVMDMQQTV